MAHSVITGLYEQNQARNALQQLKAETKRLEAQAQRQIEAAAAVAKHPPYQYDPGMSAPRPLAADERCMSGKRFRRVENGWIQLPSEPC